MASKINYNTKAPFQTREDIPGINKVNAEDMNEIKEVVNSNADELDTAKEDIESLQNGQGTSNADITSLKNRVTTLEGDNATNKSDINNLKSDNETNKSDIDELQEDNETNKTNITNLQNNKVDKIEGKGLSTEDFTTELKTKLEGLENYNDTEVKADITKLKGKVTTLEEDNATNKSNIKNLQEDNTQNKADIEDLQESQTSQDSDIATLMNALPFEIQEGENINIKGTIPVKFKEFVVGGNSKQETRSGKNMINVIKETLTTNGITFTNNKDGSITINGTATDTAFFAMLEQTFTFKQGQTYSAYLGGTTKGLSMTIRRNSINEQLLILPDGQEAITQNYSGETADDAYAYIRVAAGTTLNNVTVYPMLVEGSEIGEWEPYGAMPSPEYPSKIQNVEGNVNVSVCNKNRLNLKNIGTQTNCNVNINKDGLEVTVTNNYNPSFYIDCDLQPGTYYLHLNRPVNSFNAVFYGVENVPLIGNKYNSGVITLQEKCTSIRVNTGSTDGNYTLNYEDFYINVGNEDLGYVPHQEQTVLFPLAENQKLMLGDYLAADGIHHVRKQDTVTGTTKVFEDAKENGSYMCNIKEAGILNGKTITFNESVTNAIVEYELAEEEIEAYTEEQQEAYNQICNLKAYKGETNIFSTNEISPIFEVTAIKDINSVITQLNQLILENGGN